MKTLPEILDSGLCWIIGHSWKRRVDGIRCENCGCRGVIK